MKKFMGEDFLLQNPTAEKLFHDYAEDMPIFDYHCHLPPFQVAENTQFDNMAAIWLAGDHYKWRGMRANGVDERLLALGIMRDELCRPVALRPDALSSVDEILNGVVVEYLVENRGGQL